MPLSSDLSTLEALYNTLKNDVDYAHSIVSETGTSLDAAVWESPNADAFRAAWDEPQAGAVRGRPRGSGHRRGEQPQQQRPGQRRDRCPGALVRRALRGGLSFWDLSPRVRFDKRRQ